VSQSGKRMNITISSIRAPSTRYKPMSDRVGIIVFFFDFVDGNYFEFDYDH
jgi:hypothetical protein